MSRDLLSIAIAKLTAPLARRVRLMVSRVVLSAINDGGGLQVCQLKILGDEVRDGVERLQEYGFTSVPHAGAEGVMVALAGNHDIGLLIAVDDRRYRLRGMVGGEVAVHDDQGQKVHFKRDNIEVSSPTLIEVISPIVTIKASDHVRMETPLLEVTGEIKDRCDLASGMTMFEMRDIFDEHEHGENGGAGPTDPPSTSMNP